MFYRSYLFRDADAAWLVDILKQSSSYLQTNWNVDFLNQAIYTKLGKNRQMRSGKVCQSNWRAPILFTNRPTFHTGWPTGASQVTTVTPKWVTPRYHLRYTCIIKRARRGRYWLSPIFVASLCGRVYLITRNLQGLWVCANTMERKHAVWFPPLPRVLTQMRS